MFGLFLASGIHNAGHPTHSIRTIAWVFVFVSLPLYYAFREALDMVLEEGMEKRIRRHRVCAEAFYAGLTSLGLTPFAKPDARSNMIIAVNYLQGMDDKKFRGLLSSEFKVLIAGGFGFPLARE